MELKYLNMFLLSIILFKRIIYFSVRFTFPKFDLFKQLSFDAFGIALLTYALHLRMTNKLRRKQKNKIDNRQV